MCTTQNIFYECGCLEDTKHTMCNKSQTPGHYPRIMSPSVKNHPCAACFTEGVAEKANKTKESKQGKP